MGALHHAKEGAHAGLIKTLNQSNHDPPDLHLNIYP